MHELNSSCRWLGMVHQ